MASKKISEVIRFVQSSSPSTQKISRKAAGKNRLTFRGYVVRKYAIAGISSFLIKVPYVDSRAEKMRSSEDDIEKLIPVGQRINLARPPKQGPFN